MSYTYIFNIYYECDLKPLFYFWRPGVGRGRDCEAMACCGEYYFYFICLPVGRSPTNCTGSFLVLFVGDLQITGFMGDLLIAGPPFEIFVSYLGTVEFVVNFS